MRRAPKPNPRAALKCRLRRAFLLCTRPGVDPLDAECLCHQLLQPAPIGWLPTPRPRRWPGLFKPFKPVSRGP